MQSAFRCRFLMLLLLVFTCRLPVASGAESASRFVAGAAEVDITPTHFPAIISGGFFERLATQAQDRLHARAIVLGEGKQALAILIIDSLFIPRELADSVKQAASAVVGIGPERMLFAAIHTHSAPSLAGALGTGVDEDYVRSLPDKLIACLRRAAENRQPAHAGVVTIAAPDHTHCRRWIRRPDKIDLDPFGQRTVRAMMHPGYQNPDYIGPAGAVDDQLGLLAISSLSGEPLAVLANYSMHYFGAAPVSADYFGRFCEGLARRIAAGTARPPVVIMAQGTAGDLHWMDYSQPKKAINMDAYTNELVEIAYAAFQKVQYRDDLPLAIAQTALTLKRRTPDAQRLQWAQATLGRMEQPKPRTRPELYALEQLCLQRQPQRELLLQAVRIGDLALTAIPCEVFGITGLKLKQQSPLPVTFNLELANGCEGYIPPPEQHALGGYTTWPARSAGLEVEAEPKIVAAVLQLLEQVAGRPRRGLAPARTSYSSQVAASKPCAWWRLQEIEGATAADSSGNRHPATLHSGFALYLEGPQTWGSSVRAVHFAGGRLAASLPIADRYSVEMWFWNGLPTDVRPVTGVLFQRSVEGVPSPRAECFGIMGKGPEAGRLFFAVGPRSQKADKDSFPSSSTASQPPGQTRVAGKTPLQPKTWYHVALVRDGRQITVYLNGRCDLSAPIPDLPTPRPVSPVVIAGDDGQASFEGKLCEVAVYDRAIAVDEIRAHLKASKQ